MLHLKSEWSEIVEIIICLSLKLFQPLAGLPRSSPNPFQVWLSLGCIHVPSGHIGIFLLLPSYLSHGKLAELLQFDHTRQSSDAGQTECLCHAFLSQKMIYKLPKQFPVYLPNLQKTSTWLLWSILCLFKKNKSKSINQTGKKVIISRITVNREGYWLVS